MEPTFYFIVFYYSNSRQLFQFETRKMVCRSDNELPTLKARCRKYCRQISCNGFGYKASDVTYRLIPIPEYQYRNSDYRLL